MSTRAIFVFTALLYGAGCSVNDSTDPQQDVGPVIASYALTAVDSNALPCCAVDSAGVQVTIVGGALTFHGPTNYRDTVNTPGGPMSAACVHGVPNGANVNTFTYTVTLPDSTKYLQLPCDRGAYTLLVVRQLVTGSSATTDSVTASFGAFTAGPNAVELIDSKRPFAFHASVTVPTIFVNAPAHQYRFDPGH